MNCPYCDIHIDEHKALDCLNLWVMQNVFGWTTSTKPYKGNFYPEGSYFVIWHQPDDFMPETLLIVSQAFDKDGNNLRSTEENPFGMWEEGPSYRVPFFYSTKMADAWLVMEKFHDTMRRLLRNKGMEYWECTIDYDYVGKGDTVPLAICRAAIKISQ